MVQFHRTTTRVLCDVTHCFGFGTPVKLAFADISYWKFQNQCLYTNWWKFILCNNRNHVSLLWKRCKKYFFVSFVHRNIDCYCIVKNRICQLIKYFYSTNSHEMIKSKWNNPNWIPYVGLQLFFDWVLTAALLSAIISNLLSFWNIKK